jgi:3-hydroxyisobutyrate dehydrogenase
MSVVTWIGLGKMGVPMAHHLVEAGHDVRGFDTDRVAAREAEAAGIPVYSSPADAASGADVVITMLPAGQHVHKALAGPNGLFSVASKNTLFVDFSTIGIDHAKEIHAVAEAHGQRFVDAPVSGGVTGASDGTLSFMVGGSERNFASARPFIEPIAGEDKIFHTGGPGAGQAFKVVNNLIMAVCVAVSSEGLLLAERLGLDAKLFYDVAVVSSADNFALRDWCPAPGVVERAPSSHGYEAGFRAKLILKDLGLALDSGVSTGTELAITRTVHALYSQMVNMGGGEYDCTAMLPALAGRLQPKDGPSTVDAIAS